MDFRLLLFLAIGWSTCEGLPLACQDVRHGTCEMENYGHLVCVGASPSVYYNDVSQNVTNVTLCAWPYRTFKVNKHLGHLRGLRHLLLSSSSLRRVEPFSDLPQLKTVNLTQLQLSHLEEDVFSGLSQLTSVDLRHNQLSSLNSSVFTGLPALQQIFLIGNNWSCDPGLLWIIANESGLVGYKVQDRDQLYCEGKTKTTPKPLMLVMKIIQETQNQCPAPCNCSVGSVVRAYTTLVTEKGQLTPNIKVNCNHLNLTAMPTHLPNFTASLSLQDNHLTTVEEIVFNPHYSNVRELNLENNKVTSVNILEGSHWIKTFTIINLRGNRLRQIPLYALDHVLQDYHMVVAIYLGNNPWMCDCKFTIHFRDFIKKYNKVIKDIKDIRCGSVDGDENSNKMIMELGRRDLCHLEDSVKLTTLDKLNIFLACMIVVVVSIFLFNLTVYKTTGRLPWMVAELF